MLQIDHPALCERRRIVANSIEDDAIDEPHAGRRTAMQRRYGVRRQAGKQVAELV